MWYDIKLPDKLLSDSDLGLELNRDKVTRIFILDAPTQAGKTRFVDNFGGGRQLKVPANIISETIFYTFPENIRTNAELLTYFLSSICLDFLILEDIDVAFKDPEIQSSILASLIYFLQKSYKIILTGIDVSRVNKEFLNCIEGLPYRYYKFSRDSNKIKA